MFKKFAFLVFVAAILMACHTSQTLRLAPTPEPTPAKVVAGKVIWESGSLANLPTLYDWVQVGSTTNPTVFAYQVGGSDVKATISWRSEGVIEIRVSNHTDNIPCVYYSPSYREWILADGVLARVWISDPESQYGMLGVKNEVKFYFTFGSGVIKVAIAK